MSAGSQIWEQPTLAQVHLQPSSVCDTQHRLLWHIPTQAFCSITEICITERKRARSSGKYYITLLLKCCPYLGTLLLQSLPLKGNKAEGRRMRTVWRPPFAPSQAHMKLSEIHIRWGTDKDQECTCTFWLSAVASVTSFQLGKRKAPLGTCCLFKGNFLEL